MKISFTNRHANLGIGSVENIGAMAGTVHPRRHHVLIAIEISECEIFSQCDILIADRLRNRDGARTCRRDVGEILFRKHIIQANLGNIIERRILREGRQIAIALTLKICLLDHARASQRIRTAQPARNRPGRPAYYERLGCREVSRDLLRRDVSRNRFQSRKLLIGARTNHINAEVDEHEHADRCDREPSERTMPVEGVTLYSLLFVLHLFSVPNHPELVTRTFAR